jgi:hypothetical protein
MQAMKRNMKRITIGLAFGWGVLALTLPASAGGIDDFKLVRAIPADAMVVVHTRGHDGEKFVDEQLKRVWAEIEKQGFDRDVKRLVRAAIVEQGGDAAAFDTQWQQITDLAAGVSWSGLCRREGAFAAKLTESIVPMEFVALMIPPADEVQKDFAGLAAILKGVVGLAAEGQLTLASEGEGEAAVHKLTFADPQLPPGLGLTLARHKDVIVIGFGTALPQQALALLRGQTPEAGALASTARFKEAFKRLPAPTDGFYYVDCAALLGQVRALIDTVARSLPPAGPAPVAEPPTRLPPEVQAASSQPAGTQPARKQPTGTRPARGPRARTTQPAAGAGVWLGVARKVVDLLDVYEYAAGVATTEGMKTTSESVTVLRADAKGKPLYRVLYAGGPVRDPLKFIPKEATAVSVGSGIDLGALYKELINFVATEVPNGKGLVEMFKQAQADAGWSIEEDVLSWLGRGCGSFSAPIPTPFKPGSVFMVHVRDEAKAKAALDRICTALSQQFAQQQVGAEDAKIEGLEGFKRILLPPMLAMFVGQPVVGVADGQLFLASGPEIVTAALKVSRGEHDSFAKSERFQSEGLPLENVSSFSFDDLTSLGDQIGQVLAMVPIMSWSMPPEMKSNPMVVTVMSVAGKAGKVARQLNFYKSRCEVTSFDGQASRTKSVTHYQEPPKREPTTQPAESQPGAVAPVRPAPGKASDRK